MWTSALSFKSAAPHLDIHMFAGGALPIPELAMVLRLGLSSEVEFYNNYAVHWNRGQASGDLSPRDTYTPIHAPQLFPKEWGS